MNKHSRVFGHTRRTGTALLLFVTYMFATMTMANLNAAPKDNSVNVIPTITNISVLNGQLIASGTASVTRHGKTTTAPFTAPVNLALADDQTGAGACPILDLMLGPINLDLLGLVVETSPICLDLTAIPGG